MKAHFEQNLSSPISVTDIRHDDFHSHTPGGATGLSWLLPFERPKARILKGYLSLTLPYRFFECRGGAKFKTMKTTVNPENFIRRLSWFISKSFTNPETRDLQFQAAGSEDLVIIALLIIALALFLTDPPMLQTNRELRWLRRTTAVADAVRN